MWGFILITLYRTVKRGFKKFQIDISNHPESDKITPPSLSSTRLFDR